MVSQNDILTNVCTLIATTGINDLNGGIYKINRPINSSNNDCVVSILPGQISKFLQTGALLVRLYFSDIEINNTYTQDTVKGSEFETLLYNLSLELLKMNAYSFDTMSREILIEPIEEHNTHYAVLKINFELTN